MKKLLGITLLITLAAMFVATYAGAIESESAAQGDDYIGLYSDSTHSECAYDGSGLFDLYYYVFARAGAEGMRAVEFKIVFPPVVYDSGSLTLNRGINLTLGDISTDWSATFDGCKTGWVQIYRQRLYCDTSIEPNGAIRIERGDESNNLGLATCEMMDSPFTVLNHMFINLPCGGVDLIPPAISAIDALSGSLIEMKFGEPLDSATAVNVANFNVFETNNEANTLQVLEASLTNSRTVRLTMGSSIEAWMTYTLLVSHVRDLAGNEIVDGRRVKILIPLAIDHVPIRCGVPGTGLSASWRASDLDFSVASTCIHYRRTGSASWIEQCVNNPIYPVVMTIPGSEVGARGLEYYITATNEIGATAYHGSLDDPHFVPVCHEGVPPQIARVQVLNSQLLEVQFNEPLDTVTAQDVANYTIFETDNQSDTMQVLETRLTGKDTIRLTLDSSIQPAVSYTMIISNVCDMVGNAMLQYRRNHVLIPLAIAHSPISCGVPGSDVSASWSATDAAFSVTSTCLYYKRVGSASWIEQCENNPINPVVMTIPGDSVGQEGVEYYITATNGIGVTAYHGSADAPHLIPICPPVPCERPIISLRGYHSIEYANPIWRVYVEVFNGGPGAARNAIATMNTDVSWLTIPDPVCSYGDIQEGSSSLGETDSYTFDLSNNPGGSFNVWFDVTYEDSCGNQYHVRLDPEFGIDGEHVGTPEAITAYHLAQNYPNPFNPITTIDYQLPLRSRVSLKIFDVSGKLVRTLVDEYEGAGSHDALWDGKDSFGKAVASSIYFYELRAGSYRETKRMVLLR
jgi:hypothetical protein